MAVIAISHVGDSLFTTMVPRVSVVFTSIIALLASVTTQAATLYKHVDSNGKVTYSEMAPYDSTGKVIRLDIPIDINTSLTPPTPKVVETAKEAPKAPEVDYLTKRRMTRNALESRLSLARKAVDEAKSALENATMAEDEKQIVMVPTAAAQPDKSDQKTSTTRAENRMCGTVTRNGHQVQACGRVVGNENFIARMDALEKELKRAEEELAEAEIAYRRGVD